MGLGLTLCFLKIIFLTISFFLFSDQSQQASRAISVCSEVLQSNPENVNVLKDRAEAYIQDDQYEEGKPVRLVNTLNAVMSNNLYGQAIVFFSL